MVREAESHAEEDKHIREKAEVHNEADNLIYATEKSLKDYGDKVTDQDKSNIENAIAELRKVMNSDNVQEIKSKTEALKQTSYKLAEEVYKNTQAQGAQGGAQAQTNGESEQQTAGKEKASQGAKKGNVEDVDYEVVDDDDKK